MKCDNCGSTESVKTFHGYDTCEKDDPWPACFDCRWPYLRTRIHGPDATGPPGAVTVPEPEPEPINGQSSFSDFL